MFDEILKLLNIDKIDESKQNEIKEKIENIIDVKARERADTIINEEKDKLIEDFETKFEDYKNDITSKFSTFVDGIIDEELHIPENIMEYARKGELYNDVINELKIKLSIDEDLIDNEIKETLKEARDEIIKLKDECNKVTNKLIEIEEDNKIMSSNLYLREKCDGLDENKKIKVISLLEDVRNKDDIDKKFDIIVSNLLESDGFEGDDGESEVDVKSFTYVCPKCEKIFKKKEKGDYECDNPDHPGTKLQLKKDISGDVNEDVNPFTIRKNRWIEILKTNKI